MPIFLDTLGNATVSIAICDRCKMKRAHSVMRNDPNFPGLRVCDQGCADQIDPYRLAARKTERINIRFPRPDVSVADTNTYLITGGNNQFILSTEGNTQTPTQTGNNDTIAPSPPTSP